MIVIASMPPRPARQVSATATGLQKRLPERCHLFSISSLHRPAACKLGWPNESTRTAGHGACSPRAGRHEAQAGQSAEVGTGRWSPGRTLRWDTWQTGTALLAFRDDPPPSPCAPNLHGRLGSDQSFGHTPRGAGAVTLVRIWAEMQRWGSAGPLTAGRTRGPAQGRPAKATVTFCHIPELLQ